MSRRLRGRGRKRSREASAVTWARLCSTAGPLDKHAHRRVYDTYSSVERNDSFHWTELDGRKSQSIAPDEGDTHPSRHREGGGRRVIGGPERGGAPAQAHRT